MNDAQRLRLRDKVDMKWRVNAKLSTHPSPPVEKPISAKVNKKAHAHTSMSTQLNTYADYVRENISPA